MAEFSDSPPPNLSGSPKLAEPNKTLDESSPTASIRNLVAHSLSISSPIPQIQATSAAKPDGSSPFPSSKTLIFNSEENRDMNLHRDESSSSPSDKTRTTSSQENKCSDSQIISAARNSLANNNNPLKFTSTSGSYPYSRPNNRPRRRYIVIDDCESDDDDFYKIKLPKILQFSWLFPPKSKPTGVGAGLYNSGNTCFIASVLQCFTHTVPLIESLRSYMHQSPCNCGNEKFCVMLALRDHIELALRSSGDKIRIDRFRDNLNHFSSDFEIDRQEDAHEFLQSFLDKLERCCLDPRISSQDLNIVDSVFGGRLMSTLRCCNCNSVSNTYEPSLGWSLEIEDVDNLWNALESFTRVEKLEDQLTCDNCKEKVTKEKQLKLDKLPPVATFHLKRFKNNGVTMEKISKTVQFPLELDLLPYMSSNQNPEVSTKYHLYAFVEHFGDDIETSGHYSSFVRSAPETWHEFDDSKVKRISEDKVLSQHAYILFYAREGTPLFSSTFEQLKTEFQATPSPKSVLDNSYESVGNSNKACKDSVGVSILDVYRSYLYGHEPKEEVSHSADSSNNEDSFEMIDALKSPDAHESDTETSQQREPESCPAGNKANIDEFEKLIAETSQQKEPESSSAADTVSTDATHVPLLKVQNQDLSPKRKAGERATVVGAYEPKLKIQKSNSHPKHQAGERATVGGAYEPKLKIQKPFSRLKHQGSVQIKRRKFRRRRKNRR